MSASAKYSLVVLFDHELRAAARALELFDAEAGKSDIERDSATTSRLGSEALTACWAALEHLIDDQDAPLIVLAHNAREFKKTRGGKP